MEKKISRPKAIHLHRESRQLELVYGESKSFFLSFEFLRISSPSAEVRGHSPDQGKIQVGKKNVLVSSIKKIGNYAIQLVFDDGHDSGIYSWEYLNYLITNSEGLWSEYLKKLSEEGCSRDPDEQILKFEPY